MGKSKIDMYTKYVKDFGFEDVNSFLTAGKSTQGLLVCEKSKALLYRIYPALKNFPKSEKIASSRNFTKSILKNRPYIMLENDVLKINEEEIKCYIETTKAKNGN